MIEIDVRDPAQLAEIKRQLEAATKEHDAEMLRIEECVARGEWHDGDVVAFLGRTAIHSSLPPNVREYLYWWLASRSAAFQVARDAGMIPESHKQFGAARLRSGLADSPELKSAIECLSDAVH